MHIKLVVNSFPKSSETFLFNLVTGLEKEGLKVTVCANATSVDKKYYTHKMKNWSGNIQFFPARLNFIVRFFKIVGYALSNPLFFTQSIWKNGVKKGARIFSNVSCLISGKPDIIHFSYSGLGITYLDCFPYLNKHGIKTIVSCRGTAEKVKPLLDPERGEKLKHLFLQVDKVHCVSNNMMNELACYGLTSKKAFVNYPSIEVDKFKRQNSFENILNEKFNIITTGNLNFSKGYIFALQAMKILKERGFDFLYHILGEGEDRPMITYIIHQFGLAGHVKLHGRVSSLEVFEQLNVADIFLLPSVYEGISNAALEAMAMEIPIVSTQAGGMAEVIQNKKNGMIVECFDGGAIANAIGEILLSKELRCMMGKSGRETVKDNFTLDKQIKKFILQYKNILHVA